MTKPQVFSLLAIAVLLAAPAFGGEPMKMRCEEWHPRLGQNPDKFFTVDQ
jgi:hypothetical protein